MIGQCRTVGADHHLGVEDGEQRREIAFAQRGQIGFDHLPLAREVWLARRAAHAATGTAGELASGSLALAEDGRDGVERHAEHLVQHERQALGWGERLEHDQQREPDGVGHDRLVLRIAVSDGA
jgi:hypothetical protein